MVNCAADGTIRLQMNLVSKLFAEHRAMRQDTSVSQAKRAISDYKKAVGDPEGLAELMVFYCEQAAGFCSDVANDDEGFFDALVRMFEQALKLANALSVDRRDDLVARLDRVRAISHEFGYGVGDDMDFLLSKFTRRWG
jgi:hypothetical protein